MPVNSSVNPRNAVIYDIIHNIATTSGTSIEYS